MVKYKTKLHMLALVGALSASPSFGQAIFDFDDSAKRLEEKVIEQKGVDNLVQFLQKKGGKFKGIAIVQGARIEYTILTNESAIFVRFETPYGIGTKAVLDVYDGTDRDSSRIYPRDGHLDDAVTYKSEKGVYSDGTGFSSMYEIRNPRGGTAQKFYNWILSDTSKYATKNKPNKK